MTRVFRNKARRFCVSVQFCGNRNDAVSFARAIDTIKAGAALRGMTFSEYLHDLLLDAAESALEDG